MGNSKSVKKGVAFVTAVIVAVVMVCVSIVCNLFSTKTESSNQTYLDDAKTQLTEYSDNYNYTKFEFMNSLFEKANVIASVVTENTSADTNAALVKNLGINSFVMTDADGKIIASSDDKKVGTNFLDDETTKQFKANLKGMKVKSISEPTAVERSRTATWSSGASWCTTVTRCSRRRSAPWSPALRRSRTSRCISRINAAQRYTKTAPIERWGLFAVCEQKLSRSRTAGGRSDALS